MHAGQGTAPRDRQSPLTFAAARPAKPVKTTAMTGAATFSALRAVGEAAAAARGRRMWRASNGIAVAAAMPGSADPKFWGCV
jgi:hypothetical protein